MCNARGIPPNLPSDVAPARRHLCREALHVPTSAPMSAATKRLLIGVMSVLQERDRRDAFRDTWLPEMAPAVAVTRFVLGRTNASEADAEQAEQGDLVVLSCEENQHRGKTLLWFAHALRLPEDYAFVAKMDQDVLLWPAQLALEMASWPSSGFYGGWPVDVYRQHWQIDRFVFMNGGFVVLSRDLVESVERTVQLAAPLQTEEAKAGGFIEDAVALREAGVDLRGNEDVTLGRLFKQMWSSGRLVLNEGWMGRLSPEEARRLNAAGESEASWAQRPCAWRHSSELKQALPYRAAWEGRAVRGCRCICPQPPKPPSDGGAVKVEL